jgi:hypothetical protein
MDFIDLICTQRALCQVTLRILNLMILISDTWNFREFYRPTFIVLFLPTSFKVHVVAYLERCVGPARSLCAIKCPTSVAAKR